jgi:rare lipoprotein A
LRPRQILRTSRLAKLGAAALTLGIPASAVALTANQADAQSATQIKLDRHQLAYGHSVTVTGSTSPNADGQPLALQFAVPHGVWQRLAATRVAQAGHFQFVTALKHTGFVRVTPANGAVVPRSGSAPNLSGGATVAPSASQRVAVAARFALHSRQFSVLGGQPVHVRGKLLPAFGGRRVRLQGRASRSWHTLSSTRTGRFGGFDLRYAPNGTGQQSLRVRFAGDGRNTPASRYAGRVATFRSSLASWFTDGGATACGFHADYGVANKSLPCGTKVTFRYGGRSVTATVEDRGPYVGGREWDLNQNTAQALGFDGVGTVWSSI